MRIAIIIGVAAAALLLPGGVPAKACFGAVQVSTPAVDDVTADRSVGTELSARTRRAKNKKVKEKVEYMRIVPAK